MTNEEQFEEFWQSHRLYPDWDRTVWKAWEARGKVDAKRIAALEEALRIRDSTVAEESRMFDILEARNKELVEALEGVTDSLGGNYEQHAIRKRIQDLLGEVK
jgi:hypothetical protein